MIALSDLAVVGGTLVLNLTFTDSLGAPMTPVTAVWSLTEVDGTIINGREDVVITGLDTSINLTLSGADLNIAVAANKFEEKLLQIGGTYDSTLGIGLPFKVHAKFSVLNVTANTLDPMLTELAHELGSYALSLTMLNESDVAITPDILTYTLTDKDGTVIDSVEDESATPDNPTIILLYGDNLEIINEDCSFEPRLLKITAQYDGITGNNLPFKATIGFAIDNLKVNVGTGA